MKGFNRQMEIVLTTFPKKVFVWGKWTNLDPKMTYPHNFGSTLRIYLKFCTLKRANMQMEVILMIFTKDFLFRANGAFWTQKWHIVVILDRL